MTSEGAGLGGTAPGEPGLQARQLGGRVQVGGRVEQVGGVHVQVEQRVARARGSERRFRLVRLEAVVRRVPVPDHEDRDGHAPRGHEPDHLRAPLGARALHLVSVVLEPDLHLRGREAQRACQLVALRRRQVALLPEAALELVGLRLGEEHAPLARLRGVVRGPRLALRLLGAARGGPGRGERTVD